MNILQCPIEDCKFHKTKIPGPLALLKNHIFQDHDYIDKLKAAVKFYLIESMQEHRSPQWLSERLAELGTSRD